jgi:hypothetical protein
MNDGFIGFKALGWGVAALVAGAAIMPATSGSQWNLMRTRSEMQRPGLLKKRSTTTTTGGSTSGTTTTTTGGTTTTTTTTTAALYPELSTIPSNFDVNSELVPAPLLTPETGSIDPQGAFRFLCNAGQILADDPIVYPGQPGKSHLHQFYGNTAANAYSTYESLRTTGGSTCFSPLNRSAYWMPALLDGKGNVVRPDYVAVYYKRTPSSNPKVSDPTNPEYEGMGIPLPNGLRFIFGFDMLNPSAPVTGQRYFNCDGPTAVPGIYANLAIALSHCPAGNRVGAVISAPECWDGKNLDSANHRSHVAYTGTGIYNGQAYYKCPTGYPFVIPTFTIGAWYTIAQGDDTSKWHYSSDEMFPGQPAGYTFHADWFGGWDPTAISLWTDNCINKYLSCTSGNLGNGTGMKISNFTWNANPRLVPIPQ